jgi:hypothetical protein
MSGKKQITALRQPPDPIGIVIDWDLGRKWADMGQGNKACADYDKKGDALYHKWKSLRPMDAEQKDESPKNERPKDKYLVDIKYWYVAEDDVIDVI